MAKSGSFFPPKVEFTEEDKDFVKKYDAQQSVFQAIDPSDDPSLLEDANKVRAEYLALKKILREYQQLSEESKLEFLKLIQSPKAIGTPAVPGKKVL